jgi:casein kinase 1
MGADNLSYNLYLLDFGLAKKYRSSTTLQQYPMVNKKRLTGTARYASINALRGYEQSRRDDLEAVGYVLMYFLRGSLPWQGLQAKNKEERYKKILQRKIDTNSYDLCLGFPNEFERYVEYTKNMEYTEEPKYEMLRSNFLRVLKREQMNMDYIYDWSTPEEIRYRKSQKFKNEIDNNTTQYNDDNNINNPHSIYNNTINNTGHVSMNKRKNSYKKKHSNKKLNINDEDDNNSDNKNVFIYTNTNEATQMKNKSSDDEDEDTGKCCNGCIIF